MNILNMLYTLRFFSSKCSLFHNANLFGSCIINILYTECAKIKKKKKIRRQRVNWPVGYVKWRTGSHSADKQCFPKLWPRSNTKGITIALSQYDSGVF